MPAVIARKPIHLLDQEERKQVVKQKELWLDIGAKDRDEAAKAVAIGDPVTLELGYQEMRNNLANSPGMDNKTGLWVCVEALRRAQKRGGLERRAVRRVHGAGGNRPARRDHQRLRRQSARRRRGRRDARHRLPDDRQDAGRRHQARRRAGDLPRAEHEPASSSIGCARRPRRPRSPSNGARAAAAPAPTPTPSSLPAAAWRPA